MKNLLLIGASGFVGTRLIDLVINDHHVINLDKNSSHFFPELTEIKDIRDANELPKAVENKDIVVLLAAEHRDDVYPTSLYYDVNVEGTKNVLNAMSEKGINNIIFTIASVCSNVFLKYLFITNKSFGDGYRVLILF